MKVGYGSEGNCFLLQVVEIFVINADNFELIELGCLYVLDFSPLIFNFFSNFSTLFEIIKSILLFDILVGGDLSSNFDGVIDESVLLLLFNLSLLLFDLLLLLDLEHVVLSFNSSLLCERALFLLELHLSGNLEISLNSLSLRMLKSFSLPSLSFTFLESSLGSKGIDLSLSIGSLFLEFSQSLDFSLLLVLDSLGFELSFVLLLVSSLLVSDDFLFLILLFLGSLFFFNQRLGVGLSSLLHQSVDSLSLGLGLLSVLLLHPFNVSEKFEPLLVSDLLLLHPLNGSVLDLINDDLSSLLSGDMLSSFSLLLFLENLESFDFHHEVEFFLFFNPLGLQTFVLLKLLVSDGDDLRVENHLVHGFHIIKVVVKLLLSFGEKSFSFVLLSNLEFVWLHLSSSLGIQLLHLSFSHLRLLLSSDLLLLKEFLFSDCLFFCFN